jgi:hypothetical protein
MLSQIIEPRILLRNGNRRLSLTGYAGPVVLAPAPLRLGSRKPPGHRCDLEFAVAYALFENDERLTRPFRTEREVWEAAERADLTTTDPHGGRVLDNNFEIKPCEASPDELFATNGQDIFFPERTTERNSEGRASDPASSPQSSPNSTSKAPRPAKSPA